MSAVEVKGTQEMMNQAQKGLELMKSLEAKEVQGDEGKAAAFKAEMDLRIASLKQQAEELTGKDNKKARAEKSKEAAALGNEKQYIDAVRVLKGLSPMHGFFVKEGQENLATAPVKSPVVASLPEADVIVPDSDLKGAKKAAKPKKEESAGLSKAERDELEKVKNDIIALKAELKDGGMSGGQINKDERVVSMVARMNELKEKESPGSTTAKAPGKADDKKKKVLSAEAEAEVAKLTKEIEDYRTMLQTEYKYSKKEIAADPDMIEKTAALAKLTGKK
eukprot:CAMPEP_0178400556 /NCGR_PEP_ID=MMETSP0689_2-20121128/15850_1 /TAXON_ID=160604 /ORGANISM="Amphidinium massartii, Strain CS-259" /LENGTH=277 /DNA_ID=CAMNT_0020021355 /DNA_START=41 /DNA_END=874 /DNA_ORIENTATION=+